MAFGKSARQIIRNVFDSITNRIRVDISSDLQKRDTLIQSSLMGQVIVELKVMNIQLGMMTELDSDDLDSLRDDNNKGV